MIKSRLAALVAKKKKEEGKIQEVQAKEMGLGGGNTLSQYIRTPREPDHKTLKVIAEYYETTTDYLLGNTDDPAKIKTKWVVQLVKEVDEFSNNEKRKILKPVKIIAKRHEEHGGI
ncbi:MAG: hypothetical protein PHH26_03260 [Candidatus Thermoplasmatota archaeon]|nr:hypothetical protein [Candidatus Thermoplasmatota archaeon]